MVLTFMEESTWTEYGDRVSTGYLRRFCCGAFPPRGNHRTSNIHRGNRNCAWSEFHGSMTTSCSRPGVGLIGHANVDG